MIVALAGRRPDPPDVETARFPIANAVAVREQIRRVLIQYSPRYLVSSAACGADLLALDIAGDHGIRTAVLLPFVEDEFRARSVTDRPGHWGALYDRIISEVRAKGGLTVLTNAGESPYRYTTKEIINVTCGLAQEDESIMAVTVWEGSPRGEGDMTAEFKRLTEYKDFLQVTVRTDKPRIVANPPSLST